MQKSQQLENFWLNSSQVQREVCIHFLYTFFLNERKPGNFWKIKNKAETEALL